MLQLKRHKGGASRDQQEWIDELADTSSMLGSRTGGAAGQTTGAAVPGVITDRYLADLTRKGKRARHRRARFLDEWTSLCSEARDAQGKSIHMFVTVSLTHNCGASFQVLQHSKRKKSDIQCASRAESAMRRITMSHRCLEPSTADGLLFQLQGDRCVAARCATLASHQTTDVSRSGIS